MKNILFEIKNLKWMCHLTIRLQYMNKKDTTNYKLKLSNFATSKREGIKILLLREVKWNAKYKKIT